MPDIVARGREMAQPQVYACSLCHYPNGKGRPENANITGLTYEYFMQQMMDFRNGARKTSDPRKANTRLMTAFAQTMTDEEIKAAAEYFTVDPATALDQGGGERDRAEDQAAERNVPRARGRRGRHRADRRPHHRRCRRKPTTPKFCATRARASSPMCRRAASRRARPGDGRDHRLGRQGHRLHGLPRQDLRGLGPVPTLAGRSPSYIARQLYDMQHGNRNGLWTPLMAGVLADLGPDDLLMAAAYLASLARNRNQ